MKPSLCLCMIVKDNASIIERCLSSVIEQIDEAVIVDTGSQDETRKIVESYFAQHHKGLKYLHFTPQSHPTAFLLDVPETWQGKLPGPYTNKPFLADFSMARRFGWDRATRCDYKLWLDSDDLFENAEMIPNLLGEMERRKLDCGIVNYDYSFDERGQVNCKLMRERFFSTLRSKAEWSQPVHEVIHPVNAGSLFHGLNIVHRRITDKIPYAVEHRNLKILIDWHQKNRDKLQSGKNFDIRMLFYLGLEERILFPDEALKHLETYVDMSGWDEERSLAHVIMGEIHERKLNSKEAYRSYALANADFPTSPDGLFGLARAAFSKNDFEKCVEFTERAWKKSDDQRPQILMHNPAYRTWTPHVFFSRALLQLGRLEEALAAVSKGLEIAPDEPNMLETKKIVEQALSSKEKHGAQATHAATFRFDDNEPLETPPQKIPETLLLAFAIQMWKQLSADGHHVRALQFLDSLPHSIVNAEKITRARLKTTGELPILGSPVPKGPPSPPSPERPRALPASRPVDEPPVIVTKIASPISTLPTPKPGSKLKITIWTGPGLEIWTPETLDASGLGGSETAAICMARELAKRGHTVTVLGHCAGKEGRYEEVEYVHHERAMAHPEKFACDVLVISRHVNLVELRIPRQITFLWVHDVHVGEPTEQTGPLLAHWLSLYDKIFCLSTWHREFFIQTYEGIYPRVRNKVVLTRNGLDLKYFEREPAKVGNRLIYSSSPDRGLMRLLEFMPLIRAEVPDVQLDVFYGFENWKRLIEISGDHKGMATVTEFERRLDELSKLGIVNYHGRVSKQVLADAFLAAKAWAYPTWFFETSCITAMEAQAAGCVPVTTAQAALIETVSHGFVIKPPDTSVEYKNTFVKRVVKLLQDDEERGKYAEAGRKYAFANHSWSKVAESWESMFGIEIESKRPAAPAPTAPTEKALSSRVEVSSRKLRIACVFGLFSSGLHGKFRVPDLFVKRAVTGSESCFFNFIRGMSERGHQIDAICDTEAPYKATAELAGAHVYPLRNGVDLSYDAYMSWNEPDHLRNIPATKLRVCVQQLNDFMYCHPGFDQHIDLYVMPSETHRKYLVLFERIPGDKTLSIPNTINAEMFDGPAPPRDPYNLVWSSSPDRGLHVALDVFERVRKQHPFATFKIFYRFAKWYEVAKDVQNESGARARLINDKLTRLGTMGENGVYLMDAQPNVALISELRKSRAQLYTCEPIRFTEGFGVSVLDAAAAGCVPIVSDADALGEVYNDAAVIVKGVPSAKVDEWVNATLRVLKDDGYHSEVSSRCQQFARKFDRKIVCKEWERVLLERIKQ